MTVEAIKTVVHNENLRLCGKLDACVLLGNATHVGLLRKTGVGAVGYVIATTGDDGVNAEIVVHAYRLFSDSSSDLTYKSLCLVLLVDATLCAIFKQGPMFQLLTDRFEVRIFNIYETVPGSCSMSTRLTAIGRMHPAY